MYIFLEIMPFLNSKFKQFMVWISAVLFAPALSVTLRIFQEIFLAASSVSQTPIMPSAVLQTLQMRPHCLGQGCHRWRYRISTVWDTADTTSAMTKLQYKNLCCGPQRGFRFLAVVYRRRIGYLFWAKHRIRVPADCTGSRKSLF
jgi:hypothetical protein